MANASFDASGRISFRVESALVYLSSKTRQRYILDEIFNYPGAVHHHIYWYGNRNKVDNTLRMGMLFFIYQTTRHGPQNEFRFCVVYSNFHIASPTRSKGNGEDDIARLEKGIPQGHIEVLFLGSKPLDHDESKEE